MYIIDCRKYEYCVERYTYTGGGSHTRDITYLYDESGIVGAIQKYNSTEETYYFDKNIKGDVIGIIDENGTTIVKYGYDSWGNCSVLSSTNSTISGANSIRYRGYYLDSETGFYCLGARFYNPKWRRFISPDSTEYLNPETQNGLNLYAYCINNPVMYIDPSGTWIQLLYYILSIIILIFGAHFVQNILPELIEKIKRFPEDFEKEFMENITPEGVAETTQKYLEYSGTPTVPKAQNMNNNNSNIKSKYDKPNSGRAFEYGGAGRGVSYKFFEDDIFFWENDE